MQRSLILLAVLLGGCSGDDTPDGPKVTIHYDADWKASDPPHRTPPPGGNKPGKE